MVAGHIDQRAGLSHGGLAPGAEPGVAAAAGSICRLQCMAKDLAGRGWNTETATGLLAGETGGSSGESGAGDGLSQAERAELCRGHPQILAGYRTDRAIENTGGAAGLYAVYGTAGGLEGIAVSLHGAKRYLRGQSDRQPAVR